MNEDNSHIDYFQLISRYLSGNASDADVQLLEEWVLSSPENKAQFRAMREAWLLSGMKMQDQKIDVEKEWEAMAGRLFSDKKVVSLPARSQRRIPRLIGLAAAAVVLLLASVWLFQYLNQPVSIEIVARSEAVDDRLPDGTQISLNQNAAVKYAYDAERGIRRVELTGDAFFEVERDTARPFVIAARDVRIEVLGTAFYVDARPEQSQIQVIVQSGTVAVHAGAGQVALAAGETGIYDESTGALVKEQNEDVNYLSWKTGVLVFEETELNKVVFDLERKFHVPISITSPEIAACEITATFDQQPLDAIVRIIEQTLNIKAERREGEIVFFGRGCG